MIKIIRKYKGRVDLLAELEGGLWWWIGHRPNDTELHNGSGWADLDIRDPKIYEAIKSGVLQPYWVNVDVNCNKESRASTPKNNDGRDTCYSCSAPTKTVMAITSQYQICTKCGK